jgi:hypothetical protein
MLSSAAPKIIMKVASIPALCLANEYDIYLFCLLETDEPMIQK